MIEMLKHLFGFCGESHTNIFAFLGVEVGITSTFNYIIGIIKGY